jgi:hypothetical protein
LKILENGNKKFRLVPALIGVEDEDSCGRSGQCEPPQVKPRRLTGHPRKAKSSTEIKSGVRKRELQKLFPAPKTKITLTYNFSSNPLLTFHNKPYNITYKIKNFEN